MTRRRAFSLMFIVGAVFWSLLTFLPWVAIAVALIFMLVLGIDLWRTWDE